MILLFNDLWPDVPVWYHVAVLLLFLLYLFCLARIKSDHLWSELNNRVLQYWLNCLMQVLSHLLLNSNGLGLTWPITQIHTSMMTILASACFLLFTIYCRWREPGVAKQLLFLTDFHCIMLQYAPVSLLLIYTANVSLDCNASAASSLLLLKKKTFILQYSIKWIDCLIKELYLRSFWLKYWWV